MLTWDKAKKALEWAQLSKFLFDFAVTAASWKVTKKLLTYVPHLSDEWASIIAWFLAALVLFVLVLWQGRKIKSGQIQSAQSATNIIAPPPAFDAVTFFQRAYNSPLLPEAEKNIREVAAQYQPNDREGFYVKLIAVGALSFTYDLIWAYIFKSQLMTMHELNRRLLSTSEIRTYYVGAGTQFPAFYANYSFDQWLEFMRSNMLVIYDQNGRVGITVRGKDFLKYLVHWGRSADDKTY